MCTKSHKFIRSPSLLTPTIDGRAPVPRAAEEGYSSCQQGWSPCGCHRRRVHGGQCEFFLGQCPSSWPGSLATYIVNILIIFWLANLLTDLNLQYYHILLHTVCCNKRFYLPCDQIPWHAHCSDNTVIPESTCLPKWYTCSKFYTGPGGFTKPTQPLSATDSNWTN